MLLHCTKGKAPEDVLQAAEPSGCSVTLHRVRGLVVLVCIC